MHIVRLTKNNENTGYIKFLKAKRDENGRDSVNGAHKFVPLNKHIKTTNSVLFIPISFIVPLRIICIEIKEF